MFSRRIALCLLGALLMLFTACKGDDKNDSGKTDSKSATNAVTNAQTAVSALRSKLLSEQWADQYSANPCKQTDKAAIAACKRKAHALHVRAYRLYKQKKDKQAVPLYEQALQLHASPGLYYDYGNSLSNIPLLEESIQAYHLALRLRHPRPHVVYYNIACAYSRMGDSQGAEQAFVNMKQAVELGYTALNHIKQDPDLAYLRSDPRWQQQYLLVLADVKQRIEEKRKKRYQAYLRKQQELKMQNPKTRDLPPGYEEELFKKWYVGKTLFDVNWKTKSVSKHLVTASGKKEGSLVMFFLQNGEYAIYPINLGKSDSYDHLAGADIGRYTINGSLLQLNRSYGSYFGVTSRLLISPQDEKGLFINGVYFKVGSSPPKTILNWMNERQ